MVNIKSIHLSIFKIMFLSLLICIAISSCIPSTFAKRTQIVQFTEIPTTIVIPTKEISQTPSKNNEPTITETPSPSITLEATKISPSVAETKNAIKDVPLKITFQTFEYNASNDISKTDIWVLNPPDTTPQLLYSLNEGIIVSPLVWSNDGHYIAFVQFDGNEEHVAISILDTFTNEIDQLIGAIQVNNPIRESYIIKWSLNDQWLSINITGDFIFSLLLNIPTKESFSLNHRTQDELLSWSPIISEQYAYVSRRNFPEDNGDMICIGSVDQVEPIKCVDSYFDFTIISPYSHIGNTFSWSPDGEKALVVARKSGSKFSYLLLDIINEEWELVKIDEYYDLSYYWSPNSKWIVFFGYDKGLNILNIQNYEQPILKVSDGKYSHPLGWLQDGKILILKDEYSVYAYFIEEPEGLRLLKDFTDVLSGKTNVYQIDLIVKPTTTN